jgi:hypothetical protein
MKMKRCKSDVPVVVSEWSFSSVLGGFEYEFVKCVLDHVPKVATASAMMQVCRLWRDVVVEHDGWWQETVSRIPFPIFDDTRSTMRICFYVTFTNFDWTNPRHRVELFAIFQLDGMRNEIAKAVFKAYAKYRIQRVYAIDTPGHPMKTRDDFARAIYGPGGKDVNYEFFFCAHVGVLARRRVVNMYMSIPWSAWELMSVGDLIGPYVAQSLI